MDTADCRSLACNFDDLKLTLKNPRDDNDSNSSSDSDDGCDGAQLLAAAEEGLGADALLSILVKNPAIVRTGDAVGNTVLHVAARDGNVVTVRKLIAFLDEIRDRDLKKVFRDENVDGDSALHLALKNRHQDVTYCLIKAEVWMSSVRGNDQILPYTLGKEARFSEAYERAAVNRLMYAASRLLVGGGPPDVEMRVVRVDLFANRSLPFCWTDLYIRMGNDYMNILITGLMINGKELLQRQDPQGETILHAAVKASGGGHLRKLVRFMISNGVTDAARLPNENGDTALHLAVKRGELDASKCLIRAEPKTVYQVNHKGVSPLYIAVKAGNHELFECMVHHCCLRDREPEILSHPKHATLAHLAIKARSFGILKVLMECLPKLVEAKNEKGWRPLSYAANKGSLEEVTYILTHFPKFAEKYDKDGSLPIHKAVGGGHVSIVEAFLEHCPQTLHHIDKKGRSILHIAVLYSKDDIFTYLTEKVQMDESFMNLMDDKGKTFKDYTFVRKTSNDGFRSPFFRLMYYLYNKLLLLFS